MKKFLSIALLLWPFCQAFSQIDTDWTQLIEQERKAFRPGHAYHPPGITDRSGGDEQVDITYGRFRWTVNPAVRYITGAVFYRFSPRKGLDNWTLDLSSPLSVGQVRWHGQDIAFDQNAAAATLTLHFPQTRPPGLPDSVEIFYQGIPPDSGFGAFETSDHNGTPILWTLSEPYGARDWFPCHQDLNDKIDSCDIFITAPAGNHPASNGILVSETTASGQTTAHWRTRYPIATYLLCMAVTDYAVFSNHVPYGNDTTLVMNFVYPENLAQAQNELPAIIPQMQLYNTLFGLYPFHQEKYGHAQFGWGGGMEHQTITFIVNNNFELLAHELAHHWFGDKITCGSWEDIWLNEGFATYLAGLCYENLQPQWWRNYRQVRLNSVVSKPGGSVRVDDTTSVNRIFSGRLSYAKGALILHQLRWILGDNAFFAGLYAYANDPALRYSFARTANLQQHLEEASGRDLDDYFARWYAGEGFPSYGVVWSQNSGKKVEITLHQTTSMPGSVSFFPLPVPVRLFGPNGQDTLLVLNHTFTGQGFTAQLDFQADSLAFDPDLWLISAGNTVNQISGTEDLGAAALNTWSVSPNPARTNVLLRVDARQAVALTAVLYASDGKRLQDWPFHAAEGSNTLRLDLGSLPAGVYRVALETSDGWRDSKAVLIRPE